MNKTLTHSFLLKEGLKMNINKNKRSLTASFCLLVFILIAGCSSGSDHNNSADKLRTGFIPDTGQISCYDENGYKIICPIEGDEYHGQDASYSINPMSFTKLDLNGKELPDSVESWVMVRDNVTGLIWEVKTDDDSVHDKDNKFTIDDALSGYVDYLNNEKFGGCSDWRIPTRDELYSIRSFQESSAALNTKFFPFYGDFCWSSSPNYDNSLYWAVSNNDSLFDGGSDAFHYARAVRGEKMSSTDNLKDNGDGTITDNNTGLMWSQSTADLNNDGVIDSIDEMTWKEALLYCENLNKADYSDWRLPSIKELCSITDPSRSNPAVNTDFFIDTVSDLYWSSTTYSNEFNSDHAWFVNNFYGEIMTETVGVGFMGLRISINDKSYKNFVRPVRGAALYQ